MTARHGGEGCGRAKGVKIADNKHPFVALLNAGCRRLDIKDEDLRSRLVALAGSCDLDKATLPRAVESEGLPAVQTLHALAGPTHIPVTSWMLSRAMLDADDVGRALDRHARPELLDEKQLRALALITPLPDDVAFADLDIWTRMLNLPHPAGAPVGDPPSGRRRQPNTRR